MDDISRGIATAAHTLQSVILQALVSKGVLTTEEALEVVDKSLDAVTDTPGDEEVQEAAEAASAWSTFGMASSEGDEQVR